MPMRIYTAQFNGVAVTAQQDLFEITAGTNGSVTVHEIFPVAVNRSR
jgi:hypothetical protein